MRNRLAISMKAYKKYPIRLHWLFVGIIAFIAAAGFNFFLNTRGEPPRTLFDPKAVLDSIRLETPDVFEKIRDSLSKIINEGGILDALQLTQQAFREEAITIYECHTLAHSIGHHLPTGFSFLDSLDDSDVIIEDFFNFCEGGYKHGVEGEIASRGDNFREELHAFCKIQQNADSEGRCYHGAGHEFMRQTFRAEKALTYCDTIKNVSTDDVYDCYKGVFSEYNNLLAGIDGETGRRFPGGGIVKLSGTTLDRCASFSEAHQIPCALELTSFGLSPHATSSEIEKALADCMSGDYKEELKAACIQCISAFFAQHGLPNSDSILPPDYVLSLPLEIRRAYILGTGNEMGEFIKNGVNKNWESFCNYFEGSDVKFCKELFIWR